MTPLLLVAVVLLHPQVGGAVDSLAGTTLKVTAALNPPYLMEAKCCPGFSGNGRYEGFLMDLVGALENSTGARLEVELVQDGRYGARAEGGPPGSWTGMVGEVMTGAADLALADLTITAARERVVDFTVPFLQTGITVLYSPAVLGSYSPFSTPASLEDLLAIPDLRMGCVKGGSTYNFFNNAFLHNRDSVLGRIYAEKLDTLSPQSRLTKTNKEGIQRVLEEAGQYAFLIEGKSAEWAMGQHCGLVTVGGNINIRNYGIAVKQGSPLREQLSLALLELQERGEVSSLQEKWWRRHNNCGLIDNVVASISDLF